jgi:hypothetical protein
MTPTDPPKAHAKRIATQLTLAWLTLLPIGCATSPQEEGAPTHPEATSNASPVGQADQPTEAQPVSTDMEPRFHMEARAQSAEDPHVRWVTLSLSGSEIAVHPIPAIETTDITNIAVDQTTMGPSLRFELNSRASADLIQLTDSYKGRRLVLFAGERAVGAWRIHRTLAEGAIWIFPDVQDDEWVGLLRGMRASLEHAR